jgi:WD40 repeat protein
VGHEDSVSSVAFSHDGQFIVSGSSDRSIRLWDLEGNQIGRAFLGHEDCVNSVAFSPDGKRIVSGSKDGTIRLWRGGSWQEALAVCCNRLHHHQVFNPPQDDLARSACEVCRKYVWDKEEVER